MRLQIAWLMLFCFTISLKLPAQVGFGLKAGFLQSIPLAKRDSFAGSTTPQAGLNFYFPVSNRVMFVSGLSYASVKLSNDFDASGVRWQTVGLNLGLEWVHPKFEKTSFYTGLHAQYVTSYGINRLTPTSGSGTTFLEMNAKQKFFQSLELGINFKPRPSLNFKIALAQPLYYQNHPGQYKLPGSLGIALEYRITTHDIRSKKVDTLSMEWNFCSDLRNGTLFLIEDRTDSSHALVKRMIETYYKFSKVGFIKGDQLSQTLDSFKTLPDHNHKFIAKLGSIIYNEHQPSTYGLILYNYKMQHPIPGYPFFIRNLTNDLDFENPFIVVKVLKKLNSRLFKLNNMYRK